MSFLIAIPSYRRPQWKTLQFLKEHGVPLRRVHLFLHTPEERELYLKEQEEARHVTCHVTRAEGIHGQRSYIMHVLRNYDHVQLDDDVVCIKKFVHEKMETVDTNFLEAMEECFNIARENNAVVFGPPAYQNLLFIRNNILGNGMVQLNRYCGRSLIGIRKFECKLTHAYGEDHEIFLSALKAGKTTIRINKYIINSGHFESEGGLGDWKTKDVWHVYRSLAEHFKDQLKVFKYRRLSKTLKETVECHGQVQS